jgi:hypothetical protein
MTGKIARVNLILGVTEGFTGSSLKGFRISFPNDPCLFH